MSEEAGNDTEGGLADLRARHLLGTYVHRSKAADQPHVHRVVPRGVTDILWGPGPVLRVGGPDTKPALVPFPPDSAVVGVRLRPGHAGLLLGGVPIGELADRRIPLADIWGRPGERLADRLATTTSGEEATAVMLRALAERVETAPGPDPLVDAAVAILQNPRTTHVSDLSARLGVSDRQLRRRFTAAVGYGPKTFHRIMRLGRFLAVARRQPGARLDRLAADTGHADHSHLSRECRLLTGLTPRQLVRPEPPTGANGNVRSVLVWEATFQ